jgi:hypothetical protein
MSLKNIPIDDLAALIGIHLKKHDVDAVLTGGACVTIYAKSKPVSWDLDLVSAAIEDAPAKVNKAMEEIGFKANPSGYYVHPDTRFFIHFLPPPLALGNEAPKKINTIKLKLGEFKILSPTDCVKDRLASYYYFGDRQTLKQAIEVVKDNRIKISEVKRWSKSEGQLKKYNDFIKELRKK